MVKDTVNCLRLPLPKLLIRSIISSCDTPIVTRYQYAINSLGSAHLVVSHLSGAMARDNP